MTAWTHRIQGDTEDLPEGWWVDEDNWGTRHVLPTDAARLKRSPPHIFMRACFEGGKLCVQTAEAARYMDAGKPCPA